VTAPTSINQVGQGAHDAYRLRENSHLLNTHRYQFGFTVLPLYIFTAV
jgi:hypothetical protein